jgi:thiol-disulfide isomerase/thioredoxin
VATHDGQTALEFQNGSEHIRTEEAIKSGDSLVFKMPVFDSELHLKLTSSQIKGNWINLARQDHNIIAFTAQKASAVTSVKTHCRLLQNEHWKVRFSPNSADEYPAIGLFQLDESNGTLQGTFLTETGDYRYLSGTAKPNDHGYALTFGCFDGSHAFLFKALLDTASKSMEGTFFSGAHRQESWSAIQDDAFSLHDADSLTALKPGFSSLDFSFPNLEGKSVSLKDKCYSNKVVIVQIMGSWCPNCMDETRYFAELNRKYKARGLEVIALAFERGNDLEQQRKNLMRAKQQLGADYEFLLTGYSGKAAEASKALPMLNRVMAFPTAIYIDKKGKVRNISTGFNGPATGKYNEAWMEKTNLLLEQLLAE